MNGINGILDDPAHTRLYEILAAIDSPQDMKAFLEDLCTINEIKQMAQRAQCAEMMLHGSTYNKIIGITEISSATLSRVSRCLQYGSGGYSRVLSALTQTDNPGQSER